MKANKNFYDFNRSCLQERQECYALFPELTKFHIALREELSEEEYQAFYNAEKESFSQFYIQNQPFLLTCQA